MGGSARARKRWAKLRHNKRYVLTLYTEYLTTEMVNVREADRVLSLFSLWKQSPSAELERLYWIYAYHANCDAVRRLNIAKPPVLTTRCRYPAGGRPDM